MSSKQNDKSLTSASEFNLTDIRNRTRPSFPASHQLICEADYANPCTYNFYHCSHYIQQHAEQNRNTNIAKYLRKTRTNQTCKHEEIKGRLYSENAYYNSVYNLVCPFLSKITEVYIQKQKFSCSFNGDKTCFLTLRTVREIFRLKKEMVKGV